MAVKTGEAEADKRLYDPVFRRAKWHRIFQMLRSTVQVRAVFLSMFEQSWLASVRSKVPENIRYVNSEVLIGRPMQKQRRFLRPIDSIKSQSGCPDKGSTKN